MNINKKLINGFTISERGRVNGNQMSTFAFGSDTKAYYRLTFSKTYTNTPLVLVTSTSQQERTYYGDIGVCIRGLTNKRCDIVADVFINDSKLHYDYIVISMD